MPAVSRKRRALIIMKHFLDIFLTALALLSRMAPARDEAPEAMAASVPCYPVAGFILGCAASMPALLGIGSHAVQAWLYILLLAWLTRGLHWDGLADLADALGSNKRGEMFWAVVKDSRTGAFGVMGLVLLILGQFLCALECLSGKAAGALLWAPVLGRGMAIALAAGAPAHKDSTLAALVQPGAKSPAALASCILAAACGFFLVPAKAAFFGIPAACAGLYCLRRVALREGGMNGDFLGAMIIWGEMCALAATATLHT